MNGNVGRNIHWTVATVSSSCIEQLSTTLLWSKATILEERRWALLAVSCDVGVAKKAILPGWCWGCFETEYGTMMMMMMKTLDPTRVSFEQKIPAGSKVRPSRFVGGIDYETVSSLPTFSGSPIVYSDLA